MTTKHILAKSTIHNWWNKKPDEIFWLEVTGRPDIGANLKAIKLTNMVLTSGVILC